MENPDDSHDVNKKDEAIQENQPKSFYNETIINNQNEAKALLKNLNDLNSNDSNLKRKRESEIQLSIREKNMRNKNEEASNLNLVQTCQLCKTEDPLKIIINCKICQRTFHSDCVLKIGILSTDNQLICNECVQKEISNQQYSNNSSNYYNNFNAMNPNFQINPQNYSQNLNLLNEMLKNNINRNMTIMPNTVNNQQNKMNYMSGALLNYQMGMPFNQMSSNFINMPNSQNIPNNFLQNSQIPLSQMNPQQLMVLSQILKNEKSEGSNSLGNSASIKNMQWQNNQMMMNNILMKQNPTTNYAGINSNSNPDVIRNNLINQLMLNINNSKVPSASASTAIPGQSMNNIYPNLVDNNSFSNKYFAYSQQIQNEQQQIPNPSSLLNLVSKQNNITNLNFFNNLFNISQIQNSNTNSIYPNNSYMNENVSMNLIQNKTVTNASYKNNNQSTKTQNLKSNSLNNLEFVGANSYLNNLISNNSVIHYKKDVKKMQVEDNLLLKDPEKYEIDKKCFVRPEPKNLEIPQNLQNKIFTIWDFFHTFKKVLDPEDLFLSKNDLSKDIEKFHKNIQNREIFLKSVLALVSLYLVSSYCSDPTEFEAEKGLLLLRTLKENINTSLNIIAKNCWKDLLKLITESKKFGLVVNIDMLKISKKIKDLSLENQSKFEFSLEEKITILFYLVNSAMEISKIKDLVKSEFEKKNNLTREKLSLKLEFKNKDLRKKEIERSEKFLKAPQIIEDLNRKLEELEQSNPAASKIIIKQMKELELERERYNSILKENIELQRVKENIIERKAKIKSQLEEMNINNKRLIGVDAFKSEFYFFKNFPYKLYVKKIVDQNKDNKEEINIEKEKDYLRTVKETKWFYYDDKEAIQELIQKLQDKGIKERKFKNKLKKIFTKKMIFEISSNEPDKIKEEVDDVNKLKLETESHHLKEEKDEEIKEKVNKAIDETNGLNLAVEIIKKMDEKFSEYLTQYSKEWEEKEVRNKWKEIITSNPTLHNLKSSLSMFNIRFKNPYRNDEPPLSDDEFEEKEKYKQKFQFKDTNNSVLLEVRAFDIAKLLAPKVKIWSKDLETYEMEKYFNESILPFISNTSNLYLSLHFFESIIFNLIKRREALTKKNVNLLREITEGNEYIINEIENLELSEDKHINDSENNYINGINEENKEAIEDKTFSYSPDNEKTETIVINASENNSEKKNKNTNEEKEENIKIPKIEKTIHKDIHNKIQMRNRKYSNINTSINLLKKRKRNATPKDLTLTEWRDTCYICLEYGDLVCCDGCNNAAHLFCAYLDKLPDDWYCENCREKKKKNKKNNK